MWTILNENIINYNVVYLVELFNFDIRHVFIKVIWKIQNFVLQYKSHN